VVAVVVLFVLVIRHLRWLLTLTAIGLMAAVADYTVKHQSVFHFPPGGWPINFEPASELAWAAVVILAADAIVEVARGGSRRPAPVVVEPELVVVETDAVVVETDPVVVVETDPVVVAVVAPDDATPVSDAVVIVAPVAEDRDAEPDAPEADVSAPVTAVAETTEPFEPEDAAEGNVETESQTIAADDTPDTTDQSPSESPESPAPTVVGESAVATEQAEAAETVEPTEAAESMESAEPDEPPAPAEPG
jgi:hypothetical protein